MIARGKFAKERKILTNLSFGGKLSLSTDEEGYRTD